MQGLGPKWGRWSVKQMRQMARAAIDRCMEVWLHCPVEVCAHRDYKGHYARAFAGEYEMFVGVTHPYEESPSPELTLRTDLMSIDECRQALYRRTLEFFGGP